MPELTTNVLYYGDNLEVLRKHIPAESVDLVYLDPPFNSNASYNVLFKEPSGEQSAAQLQAFSDTWHWDQTAERTFAEIIEQGPPPVGKMIGALRDFIGRNDMMAYLVMMTVRLVELRRVLRPSGSLYLHCDPTASHYLKVVLDTIFGGQNFRNEIVWRRSNAHNDAGQFGRIHDAVLFYVCSPRYTWNVATTSYSPEQLKRYKTDEDGRLYTGQDLTASRPDSDSGKFNWRGTMPPPSRGWGYKVEQLEKWWAEGRILTKKDGTPRMDGLKKYLDEMPGKPLQSMWADIPRIANTSPERLGYPTQKPLALLERIIQASSNEGDVVLDPFCGCGTAVVAAQKLGRRWIGMDLTHLAITVMKKRLLDSFELRPGRDYQVVGEPADLAGARALAAQDRYQFQYWAVSLVVASPVGDDRKKGADRGVDGVIGFVEQGGKARQIIVQVKSGHVNAAQVRDLKGVMEREKAEMGLFITLEPSTAPMRLEAVSAGFYHSDLWDEDYPRLQICTVEDLLAGRLPRLPRLAAGGFAKAERVRRAEGKQGAML